MLCRRSETGRRRSGAKTGQGSLARSLKIQAKNNNEEVPADRRRVERTADDLAGNPGADEKTGNRRAKRAKGRWRAGAGRGGEFLM